MPQDMWYTINDRQNEDCESSKKPSNPKECHRKSPPESNTDEGNVWPFGNPRDFAGRGFRPPVRHGRWQMIVSDRTVVEDMGFLMYVFLSKKCRDFEMSLDMSPDAVSWFWFTKCSFGDKNEDDGKLPVRQRLWQVLMIIILIVLITHEWQANLML